MKNIRIKMFAQMCQMRVVAQDGTEYMPVWGYDNKICAYATRSEAIKTLLSFPDSGKFDLELIS